MNVWLVNQGSGPMGRAMVAAALDAGYNVVATVRDRRTLGDLQDGHVRRLRVVPRLEATAESAEAVIDFTIEAFGRLDVLVNLLPGAAYVRHGTATPPSIDAAFATLEQAAGPVMRWDGSRQVFDIVAGPQVRRVARAVPRGKQPMRPADPGRSTFESYPLERTTIWMPPAVSPSHAYAEIADEIVRLSGRIAAVAAA